MALAGAIGPKTAPMKARGMASVLPAGRALALVLALGGCGDGDLAQEVPPEPAAKLTLSNPVAAVAHRLPPAGYPAGRRDCPGCYLPRRDLTGADLARAHLPQADLTEAVLSGADLTGAELRGAGLRGADLSGALVGAADLRGADLTDADLANAILDGADLTGAILERAHLGGADLSAVTWTDGSLCTNGSTGECVRTPDTPLGRVLAKAVMEPMSGVEEFELSGDGQSVFTGRVTKWFGGRRAAVSITYDSAYGTWPVHFETAQMVVDRGLHMDHEIVTAFYRAPRWKYLVPVLSRDLMPRGINLFGHGHRHVDHDSLTYDEALANMRQCYVQMEEWGFRPRAYSYPHSRGYEEETQRACRDAGFICARGSTIDLSEVFICPDEATEPENWYYLPAASVGAYIQFYLKTHADLVPVLDEALDRTAWVVLMYHAIGQPAGWGYYPIWDFRRDLDKIAASDFWSVNMDDAAAYVQERNAARIWLTSASDNGDVTLIVDDGLDDEIYDHPLTVQLDLNPAMAVETVVVTSGAGPARELTIESGRVQLDVVPDGRSVNLRMYPASVAVSSLE